MAAPFKDMYGDKILLHKWNWRDRRIMSWINNFAKITGQNTLEDVNRQNIIKTGQLKRSLTWRTWAASGGDTQVFEASYIYYAKFLELAVGWRYKYTSPVPPIPGKKWRPIPVSDRPYKGRPHVVPEMRSQARKFASMATNHFSFVGTMFMAYALGNTASAHAAINRALFWSMRKNAYNR